MRVIPSPTVRIPCFSRRHLLKGYVPNREEFTSRVIFCLRTAVQTQRLDDADDVPLVPHIAALPVVPSWSLDRINELKVIEQSDPYIAATTRMLEDLENSQGLIYQVQKEASYRSQGYGPVSSGRYSVQ